MLDDFEKLTERTRELGNHHRKYLRLLMTHKDLLIERLEQSGTIDEVHFWSAAPDICAEMEAVVAMGEDDEERLVFLGCYFAFQFLRMNISALDLLRLELTSRSDTPQVYRAFMLRMGGDIRRLTACYMDRLLELLLPAGQRPEYVICGVGTRADQDDLDLGIIDDGSEWREHFNHAVGRMQREMLRRAIPLHFHLSEHVGEASFSASISEYKRLLDREIQDFIIITEMLGARPILGSDALFDDFTDQVTSRYFYREGGDNRFHEGYLRGMLGEVRLLLFSRLNSDSAHPKADALRIIKGIITVQKVIFGIREVNAWDVLDRLRELDPQHQRAYDELDVALSFIEIFRFLYQLVEVQEEEIPLREEGDRSRLEPVAALMGYRNMGAVRAADYLIVHYQEHVRRAREAASVLLDAARVHLGQVSVFSKLLLRRASIRNDPHGSRNLAIEFVKALRFFRGTRFWDDVMEPMEDDLELLRHFVTDFTSLEDAERREWVHRYAKWGEVSALSVMRLLNILYTRRRQMDSQGLFTEMSQAFVDRLERCSDAVPRLCGLFDHHPLTLNVFLKNLPEEEKRRFCKIFEEPVWSEEVEVLRRKLLHLCRVHCYSSHYFRRFIMRIASSSPKYTRLFDETDRLRVISKGILARIDNLQTFEQKKESLGNYYDIEFLRVGLECVAGAPSEVTNADFTEFSDSYLQSLFEVCKQEVVELSEQRVRTRDLLAVYSAGGHGRKLAFDDDYDLIVLLDSDEPEIRAYCKQIFTRMNRQIVRRGTMPQYRLADHFGEYVTTLGDLESLFRDPDEEVFIDMSQVMGARRIVGSKKFEHELERRIIRPYILDRKDQYTRQLAGEIRSRHGAVDAGTISELNVKETKGGLRDMEILLMILMARADMWHPVTQELYVPLLERMPEQESELERIFSAFAYLKRRRDLYRLTVAAEDELIPNDMDYMAFVLGYCSEPGCTSGSEQLVEEIRATTNEISDIVTGMLDRMGL